MNKSTVPQTRKHGLEELKQQNPKFDQLSLRKSRNPRGKCGDNWEAGRGFERGLINEAAEPATHGDSPGGRKGIQLEKP